MPINIVERHKLILKKLEEDGHVNVEDLSHIFDISSVTIRKDLKLLEERNLLFRTHGSAIPSNPYITERSVNEKTNIHKDEKHRIALKAASLLNANDSIILASGTSIIELADAIQYTEGLTILSASLNASLIVSNIPDIEVIQLGGTVRKSSSSVIGPLGEKMLSEFTFTKLFLGVDGIDLDFGLSTTNSMEASLNQEMIKSAQKIIVLADASKFGKKGFGRICGLEEVNQIITDSNIDDDYKEKLMAFGIEVTIV